LYSYQLIVQDEEYFKRTRWQYMILDEAQALKSSGTIRWNTLLKLNCRNRLLLTGTPIQNTMQELWALLHFIMPTLFDSHEEFSEWFAKVYPSSFIFFFLNLLGRTLRATRRARAKRGWIATSSTVST